MESLLLAVALIGISTLLAVLGLLLVRRFVPLATLQENNEVAGFLIPIVGIAYAVLLAFMVIAVWERYESAASNVETEADEIVTLSRLATGLPDADRQKIQDLARTYTRVVVEEEWPATARGRFSPRAANLTRELWLIYTRMEPRTDTQNAVYSESLTHLTDFANSRRARLIASRGSVPPIVWSILVGGGVLTVGFTYFFGVRSLKAQTLMTAGVAATIAGTFFLVLVLDNPFRGGVRVTPDAFARSLDALNAPTTK